MRIRSLLRRVAWAMIRWPLVVLLGAIGQGGAAKILAQQVAIYIRWSTDDQSQGTTLDVQRDSCRHYALSQGWAVTDDHIFIDDGYSGGNLERPAMERLREAVRQREVSCVVVYKIDRLSRNIVDATSLVLREWDGTCHLKCVTEPIDTTTELGRVIFSILATFADFERTQIRTRTVAGKLRRVVEGNSITSAPYGYTRKNKALVPVEAEVVVVRRIFEWYTSGLGMTAILKRLSQEGARTRDGFVWGRSSIHRLLTNPTYKGRHVYGRRRVGQKGEAAQVFRDAPLIDMEGIVPAIVEEELWERAQAARGARLKRKLGGRAVSSQHLLTGLARCQCGATFIAKQDSGGKWYYVCSRRRDTGTCKCSWIPRDMSHVAVLAQILKLTDDGVMTEMQERLQDANARATGDAEAEHAQAGANLKRLQTEADRMDRDYRSGKLEADRYNRLLSGVEVEIATATTRFGALAKEVAAAVANKRERSDLINTLGVMARWDALDVPEQKELLRSLVTSLVMFRDKEQNTVTIDVAVHKIPLSSL